MTARPCAVLFCMHWKEISIQLESASDCTVNCLVYLSLYKFHRSNLFSEGLKYRLVSSTTELQSQMTFFMNFSSGKYFTTFVYK